MARPKAKKQTKEKPPKKGLPWFVWLGIALAIVAVIAFVRRSATSGPTGPCHPGEVKAVMIDQLHSLQLALS